MQLAFCSYRLSRLRSRRLTQALRYVPQRLCKLGHGGSLLSTYQINIQCRLIVRKYIVPVTDGQFSWRTDVSDTNKSYPCVWMWNSTVTVSTNYPLLSTPIYPSSSEGKLGRSVFATIFKMSWVRIFPRADSLGFVKYRWQVWILNPVLLF